MSNGNTAIIRTPVAHVPLTDHRSVSPLHRLCPTGDAGKG
jgi:hypothetical protein